MLVASALVVTMIVWMNRVARTLRKEIEQRVEAYAQKSTRAAGLGRRSVCFLDGGARRRGAGADPARGGTFERRGAGLDRDGAGHRDCRGGGLFFFQGTLKIPLHRFFAATSVILMVVAFQLALTGVHELSEAMWIHRASRRWPRSGPSCATKFSFSS